MWIVYRKKDRKVVGMSALGGEDCDKETALAEAARGLSEKVDKYDAIQVTDPAKGAELVGSPARVVITESRGKLQAAVELPTISYLALSCDAPDVHPIDGIAEIKADGTSFTTVTVQKVDERGEPQRGRSDTGELYLRTTAGTLLSADGKEGVTSVKLKQGQASFRLLSEKARRVASVSVFSADAALHEALIRVEFV
jgi:hypothetical protein